MSESLRNSTSETELTNDELIALDEAIDLNDFEVIDSTEEHTLSVQVEHISLQKLRNKAMGIETPLNESETLAYELYIQGYMDGVEARVLQAVSRIDPERADHLTDTFLGAICDPGTEVEVENNEE